MSIAIQTRIHRMRTRLETFGKPAASVVADRYRARAVSGTDDGKHEREPAWIRVGCTMLLRAVERACRNMVVEDEGSKFTTARQITGADIVYQTAGLSHKYQDNIRSL